MTCTKQCSSKATCCRSLRPGPGRSRPKTSSGWTEDITWTKSNRQVLSSTGALTVSRSQSSVSCPCTTRHRATHPASTTAISPLESSGSGTCWSRSIFCIRARTALGRGGVCPIYVAGATGNRPRLPQQHASTPCPMHDPATFRLASRGIRMRTVGWSAARIGNVARGTTGKMDGRFLRSQCCGS